MRGRPDIPEREHILEGLEEYHGGRSKEAWYPVGNTKMKPPSNNVNLEARVESPNPFTSRAIEVASSHFGPYSKKKIQELKEELESLGVHDSGVDSKLVWLLLTTMDNKEDIMGFVKLRYPDMALFIQDKALDYLLITHGENVDMTKPEAVWKCVYNDSRMYTHILFDGKVGIVTLNDESKEPWEERFTKTEILEFYREYRSLGCPGGYYSFKDEATQQTYFVEEGAEAYLRKHHSKRFRRDSALQLADNPNIFLTELFGGKVVVANLHKIISGKQPCPNLTESDYRNKPEDSGHFHEHAIEQRLKLAD